MKQCQDDIRDFMLAGKQDVPTFPLIPPLSVRILRAKLIIEEALEQCESLGVEVGSDSVGEDVHRDDFYPFGVGDVVYREAGDVDLVKLADGICDQIYVSIGTGLAFGINLIPVWLLVQA